MAKDKKYIAAEANDASMDVGLGEYGFNKNNEILATDVLKKENLRHLNFIVDFVSKVDVKRMDKGQKRVINKIIEQQVKIDHVWKIASVENAKPHISNAYLITNINKQKSEHYPQDTVKFLREFSNDEYLKWIIHEWDFPIERNYDAWIENCEQRFKELINKYKYLPKGLLFKIYNFCFQENYKDHRNTWSYQKIDFGWKHLSLKKWALKNNPLDYKLGLNFNELNREYNYQNFKEVVEHFSKMIQYKAEKNHFLLVLKNLSNFYEWSSGNKINFDKSIEGFAAYCDTEKVNTGINRLFIGIKSIPTTLGVVIRSESFEKYQLVFIEHYDSKIDIRIIDEKLLNDKLGSDFAKAKENFNGQCDWTFEGVGTDKKYYRFNYLGDNVCSDEFNGCRHILKFYK